MSGPFTISSTLPHVLELDMRILSHFMVPSSIFFISFGLGAVYHKTEAHIVMKGTSRVSATFFLFEFEFAHPSQRSRNPSEMVCK